jgi:hypothetical protein
LGGQPANTAATEEYDGTSWATSPGSLNTARSELGGTGIQTAGLALGGNSGAPVSCSGATEEYNGATWTSVAPLATARQLDFRNRKHNSCFSCRR